MADNWQPKSNAPASFDLAQAFTALITGDSVWGWLLDWIPLLGTIRFDTAAFCASGPSATGPLDPTDFLTGNRNPLAELANKVILVIKVRNAAYDRVFGAYCEQPGPGSAGWNLVREDCLQVNSWDSVVSIVGPMPPDGQQWRVTRLDSNATPIDVSTSSVYRAPLSGGGVGANNVRLWSAGSTDILANLPGATNNYFVVTTGHAVGGETFCVRWERQGPGPAQTFTPTPQPQPAGYIAPTKKTYATIADLGAELDAHELKLDHILQNVTWQAAQTAVPSTTTEPPVDALVDTVVDVKGAIGIVVEVSRIPPDANERFGNPPHYTRLGRVTLGTELGWLPSIDLVHTPLVIQPLPIGVTKAEVSVLPPTTATVKKILPPK